MAQSPDVQTSSLDTAQELAAFFRISLASIRKWTRTTNIPIIRCGRAVRFDRQAVLTWLASGGPKRNGKEGQNNANR